MAPEKSRIVFVSTYPPEHCGVGRDAFQMVQALSEFRNPIVIGNITAGAPREDGAVHRVWRKDELLYPVKILKEVNRESNERETIVHLYHHFYLYGGPLTIPLFLVLVLLLRLHGYRVVVQPQSVIDPDQVGELARAFVGASPPQIPKLGLRWFYRTAAALADRVAVCTPSMRRILVDKYGIDANKVWIVPVGWREAPSTDEASAAKETLGLTGRKVVLFHGFLDPTKGLGDLLRGFAQEHKSDSDSFLVLAGEASPHVSPVGEPFVRSLENDAIQLRVRESVRFTGFLDEANLSQTLSAADVFVLPYTMLASHGGSASLSRVAAYGKPLIASRISRFADEIVDGETGLLVTPGRPDEIAVALVRVLNDTALAGRLGENLRTLAGKRTWKASAELLDRVLYPSLDRPSRG